MRIGYVATKFPPHIGGGETHMATVASHMSDLGHEVSVITGEHPDRDPSDFNFPVHEVPGFTDSGIDFSAVADISEKLKAADLDVVHIANYEALLYYQYARPLGRLAAARTVLSVHNTPIVGERVFDGIGKQYGLEKRAVQECLQHGLVDAYIANSQAFVDGMRDVDIPADAITVIPFGIDTTKFTPKKSDATTDTVDILCTSRFIQRKGIEHLIAALGYLPKNYRLHLTGSGTNPDEKTYQEILRMSDSYGQRVSFAAERTNLRDLVQLYQDASVFVMPSQTEGFGLSALEAMACGTPVVATNVQGLKEFVIDGKTGLVVEFGNPLQIARAIRAISEHAQLRTSLTANALAMARNDYSFTGMIKKYAAFYEALVSSK